MNTKTLNNINQNIVVTEELIERYENEKEKIKSKVVPAWQLYSCEIIGCSFAIAIVSANILDLGAMIIGVMGGAAIGASVPYIVKQIKIGDQGNGEGHLSGSLRHEDLGNIPEGNQGEHHGRHGQNGVHDKIEL